MIQNGRATVMGYNINIVFSSSLLVSIKHQDGSDVDQW